MLRINRLNPGSGGKAIKGILRTTGTVWKRNELYYGIIVKFVVVM